MKYILLKLFFGWLARLGSWIAKVIEKERELYLRRTALPPGTPVTPLCECHKGQTWYVEEYFPFGDDYLIVPTWPAPSKFGRRTEVDDMVISRKNIARAKAAPLAEGSGNQH
jgi:hypothetical protein